MIYDLQRPGAFELGVAGERTAAGGALRRCGKGGTMLAGSAGAGAAAAAGVARAGRPGDGRQTVKAA